MVSTIAEDILSREELESDIQFNIAKSGDGRSESEENVTFKDTCGTNSDSTFMIYNNLNEKFDQLEKSFENKVIPLLKEKLLTMIHSLGKSQHSENMIWKIYYNQRLLRMY